MIKIKVIPFDQQSDVFKNFRAEYMVLVSQETAMQLSRMNRLPGLYESFFIARPDLCLENHAGRFYLRHGCIPVREWPKHFKIQVVGTESEEVA